jgi:DNA polymerase-3 subunit epsilon
MNLSCSHRGLSLDAWTKALGVENLRAVKGGIHGAGIDSRQVASVIEVMRHFGNMD